MSETIQTGAWARFGALPAAAVNRCIDGIFMQYEQKLAFPEHWPDGKPVCRYRTPRGFLLFRPGAWAHYGLKKEEDFIRAARSSGIMCRSAAGALSLGLARRINGKPFYATVEGLIDGVTVAVPIVSKEEFADLRELVRTIGPEAKTELSSELIMALAKASGLFEPRKLYAKFAKLSRREAVSIGILALVGILSCIVLLAATIGFIPRWVSPLVIFMFPICLIGTLHGLGADKRKPKGTR